MFKKDDDQGTRTGVPLTVYPWYLLCSLGILGDYDPYIHTIKGLYRDFP